MQGLVIMDRYKLVVLNLNTCILTERTDLYEYLVPGFSSMITLMDADI